MSNRVLLLMAAAGVLAAAPPAKEIRRTVSLDAKGRVVIDTYKGTIRVSTWDRAEVDIAVRIEEDRTLFAQPVDRADVRIDTSPGEVRMKSRYDKDWVLIGVSGSPPLFHYTVRMPRTASLRIKDYKSETEILDLAADLEMETYKGTVRVKNLAGAIFLNTYKGEVRADFAKFSGRSRFETYKGTIELRVPRASGFDLAADLGRHADFDTDFPQYSRGARSRDKEYRGAVNGGGPELRLKSYRGTFRLKSI